MLHLDPHAGNVALTPRGPVVIDWRNAAAGDPAADVTTTLATLATLTSPEHGMQRTRKALLRGMRAGSRADVTTTLATLATLATGTSPEHGMQRTREALLRGVRAGARADPGPWVRAAAAKLADPTMTPAEAARLRALAASDGPAVAPCPCAGSRCQWHLLL